MPTIPTVLELLQRYVPAFYPTETLHAQLCASWHYENKLPTVRILWPRLMRRPDMAAQFVVPHDHVRYADTSPFTRALDMVYELFEAVNPRHKGESEDDYEYRLVTCPDQFPEFSAPPAWFMHDDTDTTINRSNDLHRTHTCIGPAHPPTWLMTYRDKHILLMGHLPFLESTTHIKVAWLLTRMLESAVSVWYVDSYQRYSMTNPSWVQDPRGLWEFQTSYLSSEARHFESVLPYHIVTRIHRYLLRTKVTLRVEKRAVYDTVRGFNSYIPIKTYHRRLEKDQSAYIDLDRDLHTVISTVFT